MTQEKYLIWHIDGGLGKHVAATSLCSSIKEQYPDRKLIMVVGHPEIFLNNPNVDRVYFSGNIPYFYDDYIKNKDTLIFRHEVYNQTNHIHKKNHLIESWCEILNVPYKNQTPRVYVNASHKQLVDRWARNKPIFLIQTNGGGLDSNGYNWTRDMPIEIAQNISNRWVDTHHIIQVCNPNSPQIMGAEVVSNSMSNMELFSLIAASNKRLLIDSSLQHASAAFNFPSVVLWIGTHPEVYGYNIHTNIKAKTPQNNIKLINSYLFDYTFSNNAHECPYFDGLEMFNPDLIDLELIK
jgi:ADP-heptose:LPS heptosyltransferase